MSRPDSRAHLAGETRYTADLVRPGMLHGVIVRARTAPGGLIAVDTSAAEALPGVCCVLTARHIRDELLGLFRPDEPLLASSAVRYFGEPVALVAAETTEVAREAASLVRINCEPSPSAMTIDQAIADGAPQVQAGSTNATEESRILRGDPDEAFAQAFTVVSTRITSHRVHQTYIEPRASLAEYDGQTLTIHTSSQAPFEVQRSLAKLLDIPLSRVFVRVPAIGGGFGGKLHLGLAGFAAVLAKASGRPVRVVGTREEEFQSPAPRENSVVHLESAVTLDGTILARRARIYLDAGAYAYDTPPIAAVAAMLACGPYQVSAVDVVAYSVLTNSVPTGSFRAPSGPQMSYAVEAHMNEIASRLRRDSVEYRRAVAVRGGSLGPTGQVIPDDAFLAVLEAGARTVAEWRTEPLDLLPSERRGVGLGCAWWTVSPTGGAVTLNVNGDGSILVQTGATEIGTGAVSVGLRTVVAEGLGVGTDRIQVISGGTDTGPYDHGSQGSRTLYGVGSAAARAVELAKGLLAQEFADRHEASADDVVFADGTVMVAGDPSTAEALAVVASAVMNSTGPVVVTGRFQPSGPAFEVGCVSGWMDAFNEPTFHCHVADIVVDVETGLIRTRRVRAIHDVGEVINRRGAVSQVEGGVLQGLGYALAEEIVADANGQTLNSNLHDYRVPTIADLPERVEVEFITGFTSAQGYRGLKGVGEAPVIPTAAAVGSAVRDALGDQPLELPLERERIARLCDSLGLTAGLGVSP